MMTYSGGYFGLCSKKEKKAVGEKSHSASIKMCFNNNVFEQSGESHLPQHLTVLSDKKDQLHIMPKTSPVVH